MYVLRKYFINYDFIMKNYYQKRSQITLLNILHIKD